MPQTDSQTKPQTKPQARSSYARLATSLILLWFAFAYIASAFHLYRVAGNQPPLVLGIGAAMPILIFVAWVRLSPGFRDFVMTLSPRTLTLVQSWRVIGFTMLVLASFRMLPWLFALPAGFGDIAVGVTAAYTALNLANPAHRSGFIRWQLLGMLDLVVALSLAPLSGILSPHSPSASLMTVLPMSLLPTFGVPLYLILHIISIAQARRWPAQQKSSALRPSLSSSAA